MLQMLQTQVKDRCEPLVTCVTEMATVNLQKYAYSIDDNPRLLAWVSGIKWTNIIPLELKYHKSLNQTL